jgi:hypothetical protein
VCVCVCVFVAVLLPNSELDHLVVRFLNHTHTHTHMHKHTIGLLSMSDQLVAEADSYTTHNKHKG